MSEQNFVVYNLIFPDGRSQFSVGNIQFDKHDQYADRYRKLAHYVSHQFGPIGASVNSGSHQATATCRFHANSGSALFPNGKYGEFEDVLLLLSILTTREVWAIDSSEPTENWVSFSDPRFFQWGGILQCSVPYVCGNEDDEPHLHYDIGFETEVLRIHHLVRSDEWKELYRDGHFLLLYRSMIGTRGVESAFVQSWTIWEHLFSVFNDSWMSSKTIQHVASVEKIAFLLQKYAFKALISSSDHKRLAELAAIRNRLIHFGMFPERDRVCDDAILFIRMTEFLVSKSLGLVPSNLFNTVDKFEEFLDVQSKKNTK